MYMFNMISDKDGRNNSADIRLFQGKTGYTMDYKGFRSETFWHLQGSTVHTALWPLQPGGAMASGAIRLFGKYFGTTKKGSELYSFAPGIPLDLYTTRMGLFSGYIIKRIEKFAKGKETLDGKEIVLTQGEVSGIIGSILATFPGEDEIHTNTDEDYYAIYTWVKEGMPDRKDAPINKDALPYVKEFLKQMQKSQRPAIRNLHSALIETPFGDNMIYDDRENTPVATQFKTFVKWLPVNDAASEWLVEHGKSLAQGVHGRFFSLKNKFAMLAETYLLTYQIMGFLFMSVCFGIFF